MRYSRHFELLLEFWLIADSIYTLSQVWVFYSPLLAAFLHDAAVAINGEGSSTFEDFL